MSDARLMHLDTDEVLVGVSGCLLNKRLAITKTDLQNDGSGTLE